MDSPSRPNLEDLTRRFGVLQFSVAGGPVHLYGEWRNVVRLELIGSYLDDTWTGNYKTILDAPRKTIGVNFGSPDEVLRLSDLMLQGISPIGFGMTVLQEDDPVPRGRLIDDLLVFHWHAQFVEYETPDEKIPTMILDLTGLWMKDLLNPDAKEPAHELQSFCFSTMFSCLLLNSAMRLAGCRQVRTLTIRGRLPTGFEPAKGSITLSLVWLTTRSTLRV